MLQEYIQRVTNQVNSIDSEYYEFSSFVERIRTVFGIITTLIAASNILCFTFILAFIITNGFGEDKYIFFILAIPFVFSLIAAIFLINNNAAIKTFFNTSEKNLSFVLIIFFSSCPLFNLFLTVKWIKRVNVLASVFAYVLVDRYNVLTNGIFIFDFADHVSFEDSLVRWINHQKGDYVRFYRRMDNTLARIRQDDASLQQERLYVDRLYYNKNFGLKGKERTPSDSFAQLKQFVENSRQQVIKIKKYILT